MEFDEKDLRREISYAIKNIHGIRQVSEQEIFRASNASCFPMSSSVLFVPLFCGKHLYHEPCVAVSSEQLRPACVPCGKQKVFRTEIRYWKWVERIRGLTVTLPM